MKTTTGFASVSFKAMATVLILSIAGCSNLRGPERIPLAPNDEGAASGAWFNSLKPHGARVADFTFAANGAATCEIMIPAKPTPMDENAAKELAKWLKAITGADFIIFKEHSKQTPAPIISLGLTEALSTSIPKFKTSDVGAEGCAIEVNGKNLFLWGGTRRGPICAVMALLEEDLGCRWYSAEVTRLPNLPNLTAPIAARSYKPHFTLRDPFTYDSMFGPGNVEWSIRNRTNPLHSLIPPEWGGHEFYPSGWFVHTKEMFMPAKDYFAGHPEYFMMDSDGTRSGRQICPSNPDVLRIAIEKALAVLRGSPQFTMISISKDDNLGVCQCPACKALNAKEESDAAAYLLFVNKVAEAVAKEFPNITVSTLAYLDTLKPPKTIKPRHNVLMVCCSMCSPEEFRKMLRAWSAIGCPIHIWDYAVDFGNYMEPCANLPDIAANLRYYNSETNICGVMLQSSYETPGTERQWLRSWVTAKLLWDPSRDLWPVQQDFIRGYFKKAAPPIEKYNRLLHKAGVAKKRIGTDLSFIQESRKLFDEAERLADDESVHKLVRLERLAVDCCLMDKLREELNSAPEKVDIEQYLAILDTIEKSVVEFKVTRYNESMSMDAWLVKMRKSVSVPDGESRRTIDVAGGQAEFIKLSAQWDFKFTPLPAPADFKEVPVTVGDKEKWYESGSTNGWSLYRTDLGVGWESQGYSSNAVGIGWCKKNITIPEKIGGKRLYLFFEACDEDAWLWIDGKPFAERSCASTGLRCEDLWRAPFAFDLTGKVAAGQHPLTVKVYNRCGQGGIWQPVFLVVSDVPLTAEQMKRYATDHFSKFMPKLKKVTIDNNVFFEADKTTGQAMEVDASRPVTMEYTFENCGGDCPFSVPIQVFVHCNRDDKTIVGGNYYPKIKINDWKKGETYGLTGTMDFSKGKGQTLTMYLGLYLSELGDRLPMKNEMDDAQRVTVGKITVK